MCSVQQQLFTFVRFAFCLLHSRVSRVSLMGPTTYGRQNHSGLLIPSLVLAPACVGTTSYPDLFGLLAAELVRGC
jgi:hypothetical protein